MAEQRDQHNDDEVDSRKWAAILGPSWAWVVIVIPPLMMFVLPALVVDIARPEWPIDVFAISVDKASDAFARHIDHRILYAAMLLFHVALCLGLIMMFWDRLREFPVVLRHRSYVLMLIEVALFVAIVAIYWRSTGLYQLSYLDIRELLARTCIFDDLLAPCVQDCAVEGVAKCPPDLDKITTKLSILVWIPQIIAIATVTAALAVVASIIGHLREFTAQDWRKRFDDGVRNLQVCFFGLSAILVTSTITATLFFQFPASLARADSWVATGLSAHAQTLSVFWGTVYTLTLIATFTPVALIVRNLARRYEQGAASSSEFRSGLVHKALVSPIRLIMNLLAMFAPMLFGAAGSLTKLLPGAG
jgi:hypothetical protein